MGEEGFKNMEVLQHWIGSQAYLLSFHASYAGWGRDLLISPQLKALLQGTVPRSFLSLRLGFTSE